MSKSPSLAEPIQQSLLSKLQEQLGEQELAVDEATRRLYSQDIYAEGSLVAIVARPAGTESLTAILKFAQQHELPIVPRSGGMSYTSGYVADRNNAILLDMSAMNAILKVDETNMTVRVQVGCTWEKLYLELSGKKLRTPYWGPLSGLKATIGGSLSNNSIFWGSGKYGSAAESVLGLQVALADGSLLETGAGAQINSELSFMRQFGPDITGLFLADCGALGIKTEAELPLIYEQDEHGYASFDFGSAEALLQALSEIARRGLASEFFGTDPVLQGQRLKRASLVEDLKLAAGVVKVNSPLKTLTSLLKLGISGRSFAEGATFGLHTIVSEGTKAGVRNNLQQIKTIAKRNGGTQLADSIPRVMRANPFPPLNNIAGALGERWAPIHGLFPHSKIQTAYQETVALFERHKAEMERLGVSIGYLLSAVGRQVAVIEPVFYWEDALQPLHEQIIEPAAFKAMPQFAESMEARAYVAKLRDEIATLYHKLGAAHLQIGRAYRYQEGLPALNQDILKVIKRHLDPKGLINPGVLGLS